MAASTVSMPSPIMQSGSIDCSTGFSIKRAVSTEAFIPQIRTNFTNDLGEDYDRLVRLYLHSSTIRRRGSVFRCFSDAAEHRIAFPSEPDYPDNSRWLLLQGSDLPADYNPTYRPCSLLGLPQEIRLMIWEYVLTESAGAKVNVEISRERRSPQKSSLRYPKPSIKYAHVPTENRRSNPNLLQTNRVIYNEALPVLYKNVRFVPLDLEGIFPLFLDSLSSQVKLLIRHVGLRIANPSFHWSITCAQVAKLANLKDIEITGRIPDPERDTNRRNLLGPLCKIKAKKKFLVHDQVQAEQILADVESELAALASMGNQRRKQVGKNLSRNNSEVEMEMEASVPAESAKPALTYSQHSSMKDYRLPEFVARLDIHRFIHEHEDVSPVVGLSNDDSESSSLAVPSTDEMARTSCKRPALTLPFDDPPTYEKIFESDEVDGWTLVEDQHGLPKETDRPKSMMSIESVESWASADSIVDGDGSCLGKVKGSRENVEL